MSSWVRQSSLAALLLCFAAVLSASAFATDSVFLQEGRQLYESLCSRCHGHLGDSDKAGRSMNRIRSALRKFDQHNELRMLPDEQILLISMALEAEHL